MAELIYCAYNREELGIISEFSLDYAFGSEENDFTLTVDISNDVLSEGMYFYIRNSQYAGIIDEKKIDSDNQAIIYYGRTLEGILNSVVVSPPQGCAYYLCDGDANRMIGQLLAHTGLNSLFDYSVDIIKIIPGITIRYEKLYDAFVRMFNSVDLKIKFTQTYDSDDKVIFLIEAVEAVDYSQIGELSSDEFNIVCNRVTNTVNHLICLGSGTLVDRHVIHLFTDENGAIQEYATVGNPIKNSDYILDKSKALFSGLDDYMDIYDYSSVGSVDNYELLTTKPSDWNDYTKQNLYSIKENDSFTDISAVPVVQYEMQTSEPSDWNSNYKNSFHVVDGHYEAVASNDVETYQKLNAVPSDWNNNYKSYYIYKSDGLSGGYESVSSQSIETYILQSFQPSDWDTNYGSYYYNDLGTMKNVTIGTRTIERKANSNDVVTAYNSGSYYASATEFCYGLRSAGTAFGPTKTNPLVGVDGLRPLVEAGFYGKANGIKRVLDPSIPTLMTNLDGYLTNWNSLYEQNTALMLEYMHASAARKEEINQITANNSANMAAIRPNIDSLYNTLAGAFNGIGISLVIYVNGNSIAGSTSDCHSAIWMSDIVNYLYAIHYYQGAPYWTTGTYFTKTNKEQAPNFTSGTYYRKYIEHYPPVWSIGTYYSAYNTYQSNEWKNNTYYRHWVDDYALLVEAGIEKLKELRKQSSVEATLYSDSKEFDVGDIVCANEILTNTLIELKVVKKIVSVTNDSISCNYKLG